MTPFLIFCLELFFLYLFSKHISLEISKLFNYLFNNSKVSGVLLAFLFLPGTFFHELSHYLMAVLFRVRVTGFTLLPKIGSDSIIMGSVQHHQSDPLRRFLIGIAPLLFSTLILLFGVNYFTNHNLVLASPLGILFIYIIFTLTNTMFSSQKDLEGAGKLLIIVIFLLLIFYLLGFSWPIFNLDSVFWLFGNSNKLLLIPLVIDLLFLIIFKTLSWKLLIKVS